VAQPSPLRLDAAAILAGTPGSPRPPPLRARGGAAGYLPRRRAWRTGSRSGGGGATSVEPADRRPDVDALVWFRYVEAEGLPG